MRFCTVKGAEDKRGQELVPRLTFPEEAEKRFRSGEAAVGGCRQLRSAFAADSGNFTPEARPSVAANGLFASGRIRMTTVVERCKRGH